jgi:hypothetical protein
LPLSGNVRLQLHHLVALPLQLSFARNEILLFLE